MEHRKEFISSLRNLSNHLLVIIITVSAGVLNLAIKKTYSLWFEVGLFATIIVIISYGVVKISEFKELKKLKESK